MSTLSKADAEQFYRDGYLLLRCGGFRLPDAHPVTARFRTQSIGYAAGAVYLRIHRGRRLCIADQSYSERKHA